MGPNFEGGLSWCDNGFIRILSYRGPLNPLWARGIAFVIPGLSPPDSNSWAVE